jgi:hypothetical protein
MSQQPRARQSQRWRAPLESGQAFIEPTLADVSTVLCENECKLAAPAATWLASLAREARPTALFAAVQYTSRYRSVSAGLSHDHSASLPRIIMSGHQPELFHAGVWFKNFILSTLAQKHQAFGINLIIDNDTHRSAAIRVPAGNATHPHVEMVPFDTASEMIPHEERLLQDADCFATFPQRVQANANDWMKSSMLHEMWPLSEQACNRSQNLGAILSETRHVWEARCGLQTLEVPLSTLFSHVSFHRFLLRLLLELPRFQEVHNACLHEYRALNQVRSRAHPVPDLVSDGDWQETPLWIWTTNQPQRRRLFVRRVCGRMELTDRDALRFVLPAQHDDDALGLEVLATLERRGIKLRPRALLTTLYARLVLSDLFIHGIGGAKYDELTDAIIARFFHIESPRYLTATATMKLPLEYPWVEHGMLESNVQALREVEFHPEKYASNASLHHRKMELLHDIPTGESKRRWHEELCRTNAALRASLMEKQAAVQAENATLRERYRWSKILGSREFSYCLFPAETLVPMLHALATP